MKEFGIIGYPLGHSFSQRYFTEKFENEGLDACYRLFPLENIAQFPELIASHPDLVGLNVTIPYKQAVIPYLDELSDDAKAMGAVNVIRVERKGTAVKLIGHNSDFVGFRDSMESLLPMIQERDMAAQWLVPGSYILPGARMYRPLQALVLGTGGASKAVVYALHQLDIPTQLVSRKAGLIDGQEVLCYEQLNEEILSEYQIIVNTTPLGMFPKVDACADIPYQYLSKSHLLYDVVYNPEETLFLKKGRERGCFTKNGLEMLYGQAVEAWLIWNE